MQRVDICAWATDRRVDPLQSSLDSSSTLLPADSDESLSLSFSFFSLALPLSLSLSPSGVRHFTFVCVCVCVYYFPTPHPGCYIILSFYDLDAFLSFFLSFFLPPPCYRFYSYEHFSPALHHFSSHFPSRLSPCHPVQPLSKTPRRKSKDFISASKSSPQPGIQLSRQQSRGNENERHQKEE